MSAIAAIFGDDRPDPAVCHAMLGAMATHGDPAATLYVCRDELALLGASRLGWELGADFSGPLGALGEDGICVVADASLYHRTDLRRRLAAVGVHATGDTPSHLIHASYRAWGTDCAARLEGDFAFVVWDRERRLAMLARDFVGKRGLYYARCGSSLVVASTVGGVLAYPDCSRELNVAAIGALAAGLLWSAGADSCYRAVEVLPAAHTVVWRDGLLGDPAPHWRPPIRDPGATVSGQSDAAEELRELLKTAVSERMASDGVSTVWMSGGWDSTAVFGAGMAALGAVPGNTHPTVSGRSLQPVSISYPVGDPGREDELIADIAAFWKVDVNWLQIDHIPLLDGLGARAARTDEPPAHLYESWNRALARGSRACGARVALDGAGGDQLFQVSDIYLADLLQHFHWRRLAAELRTRRARGLRHIFRNTVEPCLPLALTRFTARHSGATGGHYLDRPLASWIRPNFIAANRLVERERACLPPRWTSNRADAENRALLTAPVWAWGGSYMAGALLEEGVETRSPLLDRRVVEFALRRPVSERASGRETKTLLRHAVRGLLPDPILAPRAYRTGVTTGYSTREMRACYPALFETLFQSTLQLAELGVVEPGALRDAVTHYLSAGGEFERVALFHTLKTELWLRARQQAHRAPSSTARPLHVTDSCDPSARLRASGGVVAAR